MSPDLEVGPDEALVVHEGPHARAQPQQLGRNDNRHIRVGVRDDPIACFWALPRAYNNSVSTFTPLLVSTIGIGRSTPGGWFFRL